MTLSLFTQQSTPGQRYVYYRGKLDEARRTVNGALSKTHYHDLAKTARKAASAAYMTGWFDLVQVRHGYCDYSYIIVRRKVRDKQVRYWTRADNDVVKPHRGQVVHIRRVA